MENRIKMMLVMEEGPDVGTRYELRGKHITVGRAPNNTIAINNSRISRHHAQIRIMPGGAVVEDIGSTNGTFVNGVQLSGPHLLSPDEIIGLADSIRFRFIVEKPQQEREAAPQYAAPMDVTPPPPTGMDYAVNSEADSEDVAPFSLDGGWFTPPPPAAYRDPAGEESDIVLTRQEAAGEFEPDEVEQPKKRGRGFKFITALLIIFILIFVGMALYLWFAPVSALESLFSLLGLPLP
ncbi:MAG: FHA domain-containing protein [Anaerolineae bacterium]|nr:FHA domain-containing protein [Anaerolineae bacterium]